MVILLVDVRAWLHVVGAGLGLRGGRLRLLGFRTGDVQRLLHLLEWLGVRLRLRGSRGGALLLISTLRVHLLLCLLSENGGS